VAALLLILTLLTNPENHADSEIKKIFIGREPNEDKLWFAFIINLLGVVKK